MNFRHAAQETVKVAGSLGMYQAAERNVTGVNCSTATYAGRMQAAEFTRNDMCFDVTLLKVLHFFSTTPKHKGVTALQPED